MICWWLLCRWALWPALKNVQRVLSITVLWNDIALMKLVLSFCWISSFSSDQEFLHVGSPMVMLISLGKKESQTFGVGHLTTADTAGHHLLCRCFDLQGEEQCLQGIVQCSLDEGGVGVYPTVLQQPPCSWPSPLKKRNFLYHVMQSSEIETCYWSCDKTQQLWSEIKMSEWACFLNELKLCPITLVS